MKRKRIRDRKKKESGDVGEICGLWVVDCDGNREYDCFVEKRSDQYSSRVHKVTAIFIVAGNNS